jgi:succinate dehydrogenase / fumarate reductase membrane anchor subunit
MQRGRTQSDLGRVKGLGSAKEGVAHWWAQRVSAIALVPLTIWFVAAIVAHVGADHQAMVSWLSSPLSLGLMVALVVATFYHVQLGLQHVIEDYVHRELCKIALLLAVNFACLALALSALVSLLVIAFGR